MAEMRDRLTLRDLTTDAPLLADLCPASAPRRAAVAQTSAESTEGSTGTC